MPIRDHNPSGKVPVVTILIIAINTLVFLYELSLTNHQLEEFIQTYALVPALVDFTRPSSLKPFFTSMFLHGSILHIASNMLFLWVFGDNIEALLGKTRFILFYLAGGLLANFSQFIIINNSPIPILGASGAIAAVLGGYLVVYPQARIDMLLPIFYIPSLIAVPAYFMLIYWFLTQLFSGAFAVIAQTTSGGIAFFAHIGGFLVGIFLIKILTKEGNPLPRITRIR